MSERKYNYTFGELIDRLSIVQLKELLISDHREEYSQEIEEILYDLDSIIQEGSVKLNSRMIRSILVLAIMNREIWLNESNFRNGIKTGNNLELTHGLNSIRNFAKNRISSVSGQEKRCTKHF